MGRKQEDLPDVSAVQSSTQAIAHPAAKQAENISIASHAYDFDVALRAALTQNRIADARTLVANAETELHANRAAGQENGETIAAEDLATAKARIAMATGDRAAARAILVQAIEANPNTASLRTLMTEVMMADGRASDVRPILRHLGNDPKQSTELDVDADCLEPKARDTSA